MTNVGIHYFASKGKVIVRNSDDFIMGEDLYLGPYDNINNYHEEDK